MALTRNQYCVHERKGTFANIQFDSPHVGLVTGPDIDLRMFVRQWASAFGVFNDTAAGFKSSIQIFDHQGNAIIKIYLTENSNEEAFETIVRDFALPQQTNQLFLQPPPPPHPYKDQDVDIDQFQKEWSQLKDTHDFFPLLKRHNVSRLHAMKIAGPYARLIDNDIVVQMLKAASAGNWEIMVFTGNIGNIQIHTGKVKNIVAIPEWINVMDPAFNLHLRLDGIATSWAVKKPTADGDVHSLELFDKDGELIVQFFGKRKPGISELKVWSDYVEGLLA